MESTMRVMSCVVAGLLMGCPGESIEELCAGEGTALVNAGTGVGGVFEIVTDGQTLTLGAAAQGGNGIRLNVRTEGLDTTSTMDVEVAGWLAGVESAVFVFENTQLFCQDDGAGLVEGLTVGFEQGLSFADLDGQSAELRLLVTDAGGESAQFNVDVMLESP